MNSSWKYTNLQRKRETVLAMRKAQNTHAEIAAAVGMSVVWVKHTWAEMRKVDPRAAEIKPLRVGHAKQPEFAEEPVEAKRSAPAWDFSGENLDLPGGEGAW